MSAALRSLRHHADNAGTTKELSPPAVAGLCDIVRALHPIVYPKPDGRGRPPKMDLQGLLQQAKESPTLRKALEQAGLP